jgi:hypothetical protein
MSATYSLRVPRATIKTVWTIAANDEFAHIQLPHLRRTAHASLVSPDSLQQVGQKKRKKEILFEKLNSDYLKRWDTA